MDASNELGNFLRARRAELSPSMVGMPANDSVRRVPGLRREEVAKLAAISVDYYARLEQGRLPASGNVLAALSQALRLDEDQRAYMHGLAGRPTMRYKRQDTQRVRPSMQRLIDEFTESPVIILGRYLDILAWNSQAAAVFSDFSTIPRPQRNYVRLGFLDPDFRSLFADWEATARLCVSFLRMDAGKNPNDPRLAEIVGELSVHDPDFRRWWASHDVVRQTDGIKVLNHPVAGELTLEWETLGCVSDPDQELIVLTAVKGTPTHAALKMLAARGKNGTDEVRPGKVGAHADDAAAVF
ncbi:helix-turn-helix domain-containing protein [Rhodococcus baikonurensis]|uniref:helix-turn-helix domain-containing protein n=1 Tax=Rhodococcus erythropolis group TaxID=2840174 RepID=UPI0037BE0D8D